MRSNFGEEKNMTFPNTEKDLVQHSAHYVYKENCSIQKWKYKESESRKKTKLRRKEGRAEGKRESSCFLSIVSNSQWERPVVGLADTRNNCWGRLILVEQKGSWLGSRIRIKDQGSRIKDQGSGLRFKESGARLGSNMDHGSKIEDHD